MIDNVKVGRTISMLRQERGMTQLQLASALSVSHQAVSKWENGAALPDIQTMLELTRLFGITVEQLISGDVIHENDSKASSFGEKVDAHLKEIGNFMTGITDRLFGEHKESEESFEPEETFEPEEPAQVPEDEAQNCSEQPNNAGENCFDVQKLWKMAPFMSKEALDSILIENRDKLSADDISRFAPFVSKGTLERLIQDSNQEINWDILMKVAPFLKREMVDAIAKAAAKGEKIFRKAASREIKPEIDIEKSIGEVSQKIGVGFGRMAKHAIRFGEDIVDGLSSVFGEADSAPEKRSKALKLRIAAVERAIIDGRWEWIAAHLSDICDETVRANIAQAAVDRGMTEWLKYNMPEYVEINDAEKALSESDWDAITACIGNMDKSYRMRVAIKAANENNWGWLLENSECIEFGENALDIVLMAYDSDMKDAAVNLAEVQLNESDVEVLMQKIVEKGDLECASQLSHLVSGGFLADICLKLAKEGKWHATEAFLPMVESDGIESLMELAISQGDFSAIDILDDYLTE